MYKQWLRAFPQFSLQFTLLLWGTSVVLCCFVVYNHTHFWNPKHRLGPLKQIHTLCHSPVTVTLEKTRRAHDYNFCVEGGKHVLTFPGPRMVTWLMEGIWYREIPEINLSFYWKFRYHLRDKWPHSNEVVKDEGRESNKSSWLGVPNPRPQLTFLFVLPPTFVFNTSSAFDPLQFQRRNGLIITSAIRRGQVKRRSSRVGLTVKEH